MRKIGRKLSTGPGSCTPKMEDSHPHWYTAVITPNEANSDRTKPAVAIMGTTIERNTTMRMMSDRPTTTTRYRGSASDSFCEMSMLPLASPATPRTVPSSSGELARRSLTRLVVCDARGPGRGDHLEGQEAAVVRDGDGGHRGDVVVRHELAGDPRLRREHLVLGHRLAAGRP